MKQSILGGIDFSMTCPCLTVHSVEKDNDDFSFENCQIAFLTQTKKYATNFYGGKIKGFHFDASDFEHDTARFDAIAQIFTNFLNDAGCKDVALEGYAFAAKGRVFHIGECTGLLKLYLWKSGRIMTIYEPNVIKKFATGKGNAKKEQMYEAFVVETGIDLKAQLKYESSKIDSPISDIVDSYYICKYHYFLGIDPKNSVVSKDKKK